jgi:hypothetical protein
LRIAFGEKLPLAQDDIRKTFMPIQFNEPSPTLLQLLSFLVDAGRGVVRSTYDEIDKFGANTPVGTTQMFLEQGLRNLGAVHRRMHRAMRLLLKGMWQLNADTLQDATVVDAQGELTVSAADFQGPMTVIPVSDPKLWSDLQRKALAQTIVARAQLVNVPGAPPLYNARATETYFLKQMGADNPDQFLVPNPQPQRTNAVAENVSASQGQPIQAFPGQDHEAHITVHIAYLKSPFFGQNASLATKLIPPMIDHLGQHLALWYSDAMLEAATTAIREQTGNQDLTLQSFMGQGTEVGLDRLMAELDDEVLAHAKQQLKDVPKAVDEARKLLKKLAPPVPMDPSLVAQDDVQRQREKDEQDSKHKVIDLQTRREQMQQKAQADTEKTQAQRDRDDKELALKTGDQALKAHELQMKQEQAENEDLRDTHQSEQDRVAKVHTDMTDIAAHNERNTDDNETAIEITQLKNESVEKTAKIAAAAAKAKGAAQSRARGGRGGLTTGTGQRGGDKEE